VRGEGIVIEVGIPGTDNCSDCVSSLTVCCIDSSTLVGVDTATSDGWGEGALTEGSLEGSLSVCTEDNCPIAGDLDGDFAGDLIGEFDGCGEDDFFASDVVLVCVESASCLVSDLLSSLQTIKSCVNEIKIKDDYLTSI
jgi:hypothetical protein